MRYVIIILIQYLTIHFFHSYLLFSCLFTIVMNVLSTQFITNTLLFIAKVSTKSYTSNRKIHIFWYNDMLIYIFHLYPIYKVFLFIILSFPFIFLSCNKYLLIHNALFTPWLYEAYNIYEITAVVEVNYKCWQITARCHIT